MAAHNFTTTWNTDITEELLDQALPQFRKLGLKFLDENTVELMRQLQRLTPAEQEVIATWVPPRGILASEYNAALLVRYVKDHRWAFTHDSLNLAAGQNNVNSVLQKDEAALRPKSAESRHKDDGSQRFAGDFLGKDVNKPLWLKRREGREAAEKTQRTPQRTQEVDAWTQICERLMRNGTHAQQAAQKALYERGIVEGKQPRQIASEMENLKRSYERLVSRAPF